jgi:ABC-type glycerol-3-phosphate transport system substrate-binding protein
MKFKFLCSLALLASLPWTAPAETTIKILHLNKLPKVQAIWAEAANEYEKTHPGVKVEFFYLENEAFEAKWIAIAIDQQLGPDTGRGFNDVCAEVAAGDTSAEQAARTIEDSWAQNRM